MKAMVDATSRHGYGQVTVSELVALAGVSKSAFYKQFANKEECFLATFDALVERGAAEIERAFRTRTDSGASMQMALEKLAELMVSETAAAKLVFVVSLDLGEASVASREKAAARYQAILRQSFEAAPSPGSVSPVLLCGIFGGLRDVAYHCLRDDDPRRFGDHVDELVAWGLGYRKAAASGQMPGSRLAEAAVEAWESGLSAAEEVRPNAEESVGWKEPANSARSRIELSQRERIMRATAQVAAAQGYRALTISAISAAAGTSNQTFYEFFASKEKAFLAAFDALALRAFERTGAAFTKSASWLEGGSIAIKAVLEFIAEERLFRQINFFELHAAGPIAYERAELMLALFISFMQPDPVPPEVAAMPPKVVIEAIAGGVWAAILHEAASGRGDSVPELLPDILDLILVPFGVT